MEADFTKAFDNLMLNEGGERFVNDPDDPGGATKWGVSLRFLEQLWEATDPVYTAVIGAKPPTEYTIKALYRSQAERLAHAKFWMPCFCYSMSQDVAEAVFDFAYNAGVRTSVRTLQRAMNNITLSWVDKAAIKVDGFAGPQTIEMLDNIFKEEGDDAILSEFSILRGNFYKALAAQRPALTKYLRGWAKRAIAKDTSDLPTELEQEIKE
jgi:lysozyme family protein